MIHELLASSSIQWKPISLKRGEYLIQPGTVEKYIYLVNNGALRAFLISDNEEFTIRFGYEGSIITAIPSYFNNEPTELFIQAIRKSELLRTSKKEFEAYMNSSHQLMVSYQELLKELVASFFEREIDLLSKDPKERLDRLLNRSPQVFQEIPHKYIASYLRMTPETLSRLLKS